MQQKFFRIDSSFTCKSGSGLTCRREHRLDVELASTAEEAVENFKRYMNSWGFYTDIEINDVHEETEDEKYGNKPLWKGYCEGNEVEEPKKEEVEKPVDLDDGELF